MVRPLDDERMEEQLMRVHMSQRALLPRGARQHGILNLNMTTAVRKNMGPYDTVIRHCHVVRTSVLSGFP